MKTKYIAVPVSERLPINGKYIIGIKMEPQSTTNGKVFPENLLLEELPDHSEEILSLLEKSRKMIQSLKLSMLVHPDCEEGSEFDDYTTSAQETENEIEELLHKVKHNEK
ncbi:hypothetical protein CMU19_04350 [Elizabethkingia anophelis]|nr:hypothetical protein [Elizabethkingia anophelis]